MSAQEEKEKENEKQKERYKKKLAEQVWKETRLTHQGASELEIQNAALIAMEKELALNGGDTRVDVIKLTFEQRVGDFAYRRAKIQPSMTYSTKEEKSKFYKDFIQYHRLAAAYGAAKENIFLSLVP